MSELASVKSEPEADRTDTVVIRACANGWVVQRPGSARGEWMVFTSFWDMKNWLTDNLVDNT